MSRIFITGSADGLGQLAARRLIEDGHEVVVHGRSPERAQEALEASGAAATTHGDLASLAQTRALADQANAAGPFDAVVHNAGIYNEPRRILTEDGLAHVFQINTLAPYLLTVLIERPQRLVYMSSGLHRSGDASLEDLQWERRRWSGMQAYSDTKLHDALLAAAVARRWPGVAANAVDPGWVPTKMGGPGASGDLVKGFETQVWLAAGEDTADTTGGYFHHEQPSETHPAVREPATQDALLAACAELSGETL
jgi:NAD(P)-dependent dehydrogenase (short-subunit alcohol dehydrogenase family)